MSTEEQRRYWREAKARLRRERPELVNARWRAWRAQKSFEDPDYIRVRNKKNQLRANERREEYKSDPELLEIQVKRDRLKRQKYQAKYYQIHKEKWHTQYRKSRIKYEFGITPEEYERLKVACNNLCQICQKPETRKAKILGVMQVCALAIDHCHTTNQVRGLLCSKCNSAIGLFREDTDIMHRAIAYLENS